MQRIVQFIGVADVGPSLGFDLRDGRGIEASDFFEHRFREHAPHLDRARAAFFKRCVIEIGVRIGVQNLMRELRRHRSVDGEAANAAVFDGAQDVAQAIDIEGFGEHILHHLVHQRVIGNLDVAFNVLEAGGHVGKDRGQQIVGADALNLRRNLLASLKAQECQRACGVPAPARLEDGRG